MPLTPATRLGPYEILAMLGAGGMGEVYRARDSRLGREVAIKVLPEHLSANPELRSRFEREAKTVSSLNHPNICTLFDVGHENGTDYLVMELVEGETLAQRLARGPLPAADVVEIGAQVAEALDRAHRAGVVHRDLKPGNIMLTKRGAKLMDFGLARATGLGGGRGPSSLTEKLTQTPTVASPLTAEGTIVGTFQYMAPEQLEGREADERSDLWALGCVLYEMASGQPAFTGRSQATLISAIMTHEPPAISTLAPLAPPGLDRIVRSCLVKDPDERARSAHDLKLQLRGLQEAGSTPGAVPAPVRPVAARSIGTAWIAAAAFAVVSLVLAGLLLSRGRAPAGPIHVQLDPGPRLEFSEYPSGVAIAPDGQAIAYCAFDSSGAAGFWLRRFDSATPRLLTSFAMWTGKSHTAQMFWSPDSRFIGVTGSIGKVLTMSAASGSPVEICASSAGRGGAWSRKGVILFALNTQSGLYRVPAAGGTPVQVTTLDSTRHESSHRFPCFLPDGEHFLYAVLPPGPEGYDIYAGSLGSREVRKILTAESAVTYAAPGYLLFRRSDKVMAQRFDAGRLKTIGDPVQLMDAPIYTDLDAEPVATASNDGRLVVLSNPPADAQLSWLDRTGAVRSSLALPPGSWRTPAISPDDRYALVVNGDDLWRVDLERSVPARLTSGLAYHNSPVWSPDGRLIAFSTGGQGREEIEVMNADGSGVPQELPTTNDLFKNASDWSREGLVLTPLRGATLLDIALKPYPSGEVRPLVQTSFGEWGGRVSPNEHWLGYLSNVAGGGDLYVQSFPDPGSKVRVTTGGALAFWWMPGSDGIYYRTSDRSRLMSVTLSGNGGDLNVGTPKQVFTYPPDCVDGDMTHDGQRMLVTITHGAATNRRARVVLGWTAMVGR